MSDYAAENGLRQQIGRIEERATVAAENSQKALDGISQLGVEIARLAGSLAMVDNTVKTHTQDDRRDFAELRSLVGVQKTDIGTLQTNAAVANGNRKVNAWWITVFGTVAGAIGGALAGNLKLWH